MAADLRARQADDEAGECRPGAEPARHDDPLPARSADLRHACSSARRGCTGCAARRPICSAASRSAGPATPRCCGAKDDTPAEAVLHFPGGLRDSLDEDIGEAPRVLPEAWAGRGRPARGRWRPAGRSNGRWPGWRTRDGFLHSYCNTVPTPQGGTHEAGFRAALLKGLRAWGEHRGNRRAAQVQAEDLLGADGGQAVGVRPRPAVPGPDQGEADQPGGGAAGRDGAARPLRPLPGRRSGAGGQSAGVRHRARRGAAAAQGMQGHAAQVGDAPAAPARQAHRLHARERRRDRDLPGRGRLRRRLGQAGAQPRNPGGAAAARQDPERRQRLGRQAAAEPGAEGSDRGAGLRRRRALRPQRSCATAGSSS